MFPPDLDHQISLGSTVWEAKVSRHRSPELWALPRHHTARTEDFLCTNRWRRKPGQTSAHAFQFRKSLSPIDSLKSHGLPTSAAPTTTQTKKGVGGSGGFKVTATARAPWFLFKRCHSANTVDLPCSLLSRCWVSPRDRRCPQRLHSRRAVHPEPAAAAAAGAGAGAAVAAPGRLRQPPGNGGWAPGAEKLPQHPSPSSHSLEGKTKAKRRLGSGARRLLSCPWHAWLAGEGPPSARPPSRHPFPALPAAPLVCSARALAAPRPGSARSGRPLVLGAVAFRRPRQSR